MVCVWCVWMCGSRWTQVDTQVDQVPSWLAWVDRSILACRWRRVASLPEQLFPQGVPLSGV